MFLGCGTPCKVAIGSPILRRGKVVYCIVKVFFLVMEPWATRISRIWRKRRMRTPTRLLLPKAMMSSKSVTYDPLTTRMQMGKYKGFDSRGHLFTTKNFVSFWEVDAHELYAGAKIQTCLQRLLSSCLKRENIGVLVHLAVACSFNAFIKLGNVWTQVKECGC